MLAMIAVLASFRLDAASGTHKAHKLTPAIASGLAGSPMEMSDLVAMLDAREQAQLRAKRGAMLEAAY
jgi:hypothetical protein